MYLCPLSDRFTVPSNVNFCYMKEPLGKSKSIEVTLILRDKCPECDYAEELLHRYCRETDSVDLKVVNLDRGEFVPQVKRTYIVPAIWVNERLWSLGSFSVDRFDYRISQLLDEISA